MNRRSFFGQLAALVGLVAFSSITEKAFGQRKRGGGKKADDAKIKMVDPNSGLAKNVHYKENKASVDAKLKIDRGGVKFANQNCANCSFYGKPTKHNGKDVGTCTIFPGEHVYADAWCQTWNKKA